MHWNNRLEKPAFSKGDYIEHLAYDPLETRSDPILMVCNTHDTDFDTFLATVKHLNPYSVVPPFDPVNAGWTSRAANRAFDNVEDPVHVGVVVAGRSDMDRLDFFFWAQTQGYAPIVLLPHIKRSRSRQMAQFTHLKMINADQWIHLAGHIEDGFDASIYPGMLTVGPGLWDE